MNGEKTNNQLLQGFYSSSKKNILVPFFLLAIVFFFSFTFVLATRIWDPLWNPFRPKPEKVIEKMQEAREKIKTMNSLMNISVHIENEIKEKLNFLIEGKIDKNNPQEIKTENKFDISIILGSSQENTSFSTRLSGELKTFGETSYLQIKQIPFGLEFLLPPHIASELTNTWIKIDSSSTLEMMKEIVKRGLEDETREGNYVEIEKEYLESLEKNKKLQTEFKKKLEEILSEKDLYQVKKEFPDENIGGILTYHYLIVVKKEKLTEITLEMLRIIKEMNKIPLLSLDLEDLEERIKELITKMGDLEEELWIGKKDYFVYKTKFEKEINLKELIGVQGKIYLKEEINNSHYNQPLNIEEPREAKKLQEIILPLIEDLIGKLEERKKTITKSEIYTLLNQLGSTAELIYFSEGSYLNLCKNQRLNEKEKNFGSSLKSLKERINTLTGSDSNLFCYSSASSYCIILTLSDQEKYCLDNTNFQPIILGKEGKCLGNGTKTNPYRCSSSLMTPSNPSSEISPYLSASLLEIFKKVFSR